MSRCQQCGMSTRSRLCGPCWRMTREDAPVQTFGKLPPRPPEPRSIPWCASCGALRDLVRFAGAWKCGECWRKAA